MTLAPRPHSAGLSGSLHEVEVDPRLRFRALSDALFINSITLTPNPSSAVSSFCGAVFGNRLITPAAVKRSHQQQGLTLIELVISIVIIAVGLTGILLAINLSVKKSADPVLQHQAIAIAESYLEEVLLQAYSDPDTTNVGETRATFDNVADYNGLVDIGARDQLNNPIAALANYTVSVSVSGVMAFTGGVTGVEVTVTVVKAGISTISLVGYKFSV